MCLPGKVRTTPTFSQPLCPGPKNRPNGHSLPGPGIWTQSAASLDVRLSDLLFHRSTTPHCDHSFTQTRPSFHPTFCSWQGLPVAGGEAWPGSTWPAPSPSLSFLCTIMLVKRAQGRLDGGLNTHSARHGSACL